MADYSHSKNDHLIIRATSEIYIANLMPESSENTKFQAFSGNQESLKSSA